jgi:hypothetical protein
MSEPKPKLSAPKTVAVLADGSVHEVQTVYIDLREYERESVRRNWPEFGKEPWHWLAWLTWHALVRESTITRCTFPEFETQLVDISSAGEQTTNPTQTAPDPGSSSESP